jgi:hypothetical protein
MPVSGSEAAIEKEIGIFKAAEVNPGHKFTQ